MDSPRGRIVLMSEGLEEGSELSDQMVTHLDRCLGCMACVTACPSGVRYDRLIEDARAQVERNHTRSAPERALREAIFETFTHPGRLRALVPALAAAKRLGLTRLARRKGGVLERIGPLKEMLSMAPEVPLKAAAESLRERTSAVGTRRGSVGFLQGCVQRVFFGDVNRATVSVLAAEGFDVYAPASPGCCGALELHTGWADPARERARRTIAAFESCETVVVNAAGCGSAMKDYGHVLRDDAAWAERAAAFAAKVRDVNEFLCEHEPVAERQRRFGERRRELLKARTRRGPLGFLEETREVRESDWSVAPPAPGLEDRRVEITGPVDRKMMINALNSRARGFMADFEDSLSPTWENVVNGQQNLVDAIDGTIEFGDEYRLNEQTATLLVRPRGWHLREKHIDGMSASLFDAGVFLFNCARKLVDNGV